MTNDELEALGIKKRATGVDSELEAMGVKRRQAAPPQSIAPAPAEDTGPSTLERVGQAATQNVRSFANALTGGNMPMMAGGLQGAWDAMTGPETLDQAVKARTEEFKKLYGEAEESAPVGTLAGYAALPMPKMAALGSGLAGSALRGAAQSAGMTAYQRTGQDAPAPASMEYPISAAIGAGFGAGGAALGKFGEWLGQKASAAKAEQLAKSTALTDKAIAGLLGAYRSAVQSGSRTIENLQRFGQGVGVDDDVAAMAKGALASPQSMQLGRQVAENAAEQAPARLADVAAKKAEFEAAAAARDQAIKAHFQKSMESPVKAQVMPRATRYAGRAIPAAAFSLLGNYLAPEGFQTEGAIGGATLGAIASGVMGSPGTAWQNMVKNPAVRASAAELAQSGANFVGSAMQSTPAMSAASMLARQLGITNPEEQTQLRRDVAGQHFMDAQ